MWIHLYTTSLSPTFSILIINKSQMGEDESNGEKAKDLKSFEFFSHWGAMLWDDFAFELFSIVSTSGLYANDRMLRITLCNFSLQFYFKK